MRDWTVLNLLIHGGSLVFVWRKGQRFASHEAGDWAGIGDLSIASASHGSLTWRMARRAARKTSQRFSFRALAVVNDREARKEW